MMTQGVEGVALKPVTMTQGAKIFALKTQI
jgi:hypothetical protein